uniref:Uncharacterized protein n=1 Tax=Anguilla anguilla TaxID=7936 RepID=A0A0E9WPV6_ANGAN
MFSETAVSNPRPLEVCCSLPVSLQILQYAERAKKVTSVTSLPEHADFLFHGK